MICTLRVMSTDSLNLEGSYASLSLYEQEQNIPSTPVCAVFIFAS